VAALNVIKKPKKHLREESGQETKIFLVESITNFQTQQRNTNLVLDYFDMVRFHLVDPMHNLFLGIVCLHLKYLVAALGEARVKELNKDLNNLIATVNWNIGRLPDDIFTHLGSAKAVELKNFALYFSEPLFEKHLSKRQFACWMLLLNVLRLYGSPVISDDLLENADSLYSQYLESLEKSAGKKFATINFHMYVHMKECMQDFGPISAFWCFSFERLNGWLQSFLKSGQNVEIQLFSRLLIIPFILDSISQGNPLKIPESFLNLLRSRFNSQTDEDIILPEQSKNDPLSCSN